MYMGWLNGLGFGSRRVPTPSELPPMAVTSPWQASRQGLSQITIAEIWGEDVAHNLPLDRSAAITVPAVSRARNLLVGHIMQYPLLALRNGIPLADQPSWLYRTDGPVPPRERIAATVDDLIFYGTSLWLTERGAAGQVLDARWHPRADWRVSEQGFIEARETSNSQFFRLQDEDYILFNAPYDGLLTIGARTIRGALSTEEAWVGRMRNPIPLIELNVTDDSNLMPDEIEDQVRTWAAARTGVNGAVSWTPPGMEVIDHGAVQADLYTEGRNAIRTDIGNHTNIPTSMMDGSLAEASLTYQTSEGVRNRFQVESLPFWIAPIEDALSADKVVPAGQSVRFDRSQDYIPVPTATGAPVQD